MSRIVYDRLSILYDLKLIKVPPCWVIGKIFLQVVDFDKDNKPYCKAQYSITDRLIFSDKQLVCTRQPDSAAMKLDNTTIQIVITTSQPLK